MATSEKPAFKEKLEVAADFVQVYPNPFTNSFKLNLGTVPDEMVTVQVLDPLSKLIWEQKNITSSTVEVVLQGEMIKLGVYIALIYKGTSAMANIRLLKLSPR